MNKILPKSNILLFFVVFLFANMAFGQVIGDYQSIGSGSWTDISKWQYYDGNDWVSATNYPGQNTGTGTVTIRDTYVITLNTSITNSFTSLVIGKGTSGKLIVDGTVTVNTKSVKIDSNALMSFIGSSTITFPTNTSFVISNSGKLVSESTPCSNNTALYIGSAKVSACNGNGGGALSDFDTFNARGGTGSAKSNTPVCNGTTLTLTATPPVATSGSYTYQYKWSGNGISTSYSSSPAYSTTANYNNHGGTYTVDILRNDGILSTVSTDVVINQTPVGGGVYNGNTPICFNSSTGNMTLVGYVGSVVRWEKRLNSGSWTSISNTSTVYSENPSAAGTWDYRAVVGSGSCPVVYSSPFSVVVNPELTISLVSTNSFGCQNGSNSTLSYTATTGDASRVLIDFNAAANTAGVQDLDFGVTTGPGTITIQYASGTAPGVYNGVLTVKKDWPICYSSITYPITLTISSSATLPTITAQPSTATQSICLNATATAISVVATGPSLSYQWYSNTISSNSGGTSVGGATSSSYIPLTSTANTRYYYCVVTGGCGGSSTSAVSGAIIVTPTVGTPSTPTPSATTICQGSANTTYTTSASNATSYNWTVSGAGNTISGIGTTGTVSWASGFSGTATISVTATGCGTSSIVSTTVNVSPAPKLSGATQPIFACDGSQAKIKLTDLLPSTVSTISYTIAGDAPQTVSVTADGAGIGYFDTRVLKLSPTTDSGKILKITGVSTASCSTTGLDINVTLNVKSNSGSIKLEGNVISGSTSFSELSTAHFSIDPIAGAVEYNWVVPASWTITAGNKTNAITVTTGPYNDSDITVSVTASNSFCPSSVTVPLTSIRPSAPTLGSKIPVTCGTLGKITLNGLPVSGVWTLYKIKDGITSTVIADNPGSSFTVSNLSAGDYTFTVTNSYGNSLASATINIPDMPSTTWNGGAWNVETSWSNGFPDTAKKIILDGNGTVSGLIQGCSCEVKANKNIVFDSSGVLKLENELRVDASGSLTFLNGASLVQRNDVDNSGYIHYKRTTSVVEDFDYVYWSSPVSGQKLGVLSPSSDKYWSWGVDNWVPAYSIDVMAKGQGYIARVPRYTSPQMVEFVGVPFNGPVSIPSKGNTKGNLIGNPYPCAVDAKKFINVNYDYITGTLYFWTHKGDRTLNGAGTQYEYSSNDYASYNSSGGIIAVNGGSRPDGTIGAGQSFFVIGDVDNNGLIGDVVFTNSMRVDINNNINSNSQFFKQVNTKKTEKVERNRVWLNLTNEGGAFKQLLVAYITGASNGFDKSFDGPTFNANAFVDFYSINESKKYTIQGRGLPFDEKDEVPLGYKSNIDGTFQISIDEVDGSLVNQAIYLEDKVANSVHDLKKGSYSFTTAKGEFKDRFVLRYTNTAKLGTGDFDSKGKGVVVSVKNSQIKVNSFDETLSSVKVYDLKGSLLYEKDKLDKNEFAIDHLASSNQFMIVMVQLESGKWISEEIIFHD